MLRGASIIGDFRPKSLSEKAQKQRGATLPELFDHMVSNITGNPPTGATPPILREPYGKIIQSFNQGGFTPKLGRYGRKIKEPRPANYDAQIGTSVRTAHRMITSVDTSKHKPLKVPYRKKPKPLRAVHTKHGPNKYTDALL